jgi:hypothetical protein
VARAGAGTETGQDAGCRRGRTSLTAESALGSSLGLVVVVVIVGRHRESTADGYDYDNDNDNDNEHPESRGLVQRSRRPLASWPFPAAFA